MKRILMICCLFIMAGSLLSGCGQPVSINTPPPDNGTSTGQVPPPTTTVTSTVSSTASWKVFTDVEQGITFSYPETLPTTYLRGAEWPPKVAVAAGSLQCTPTSPASVSPESAQVKSIQINGNAYCIRFSAEGAAGSIYTDYTYSTAKAGRIIAVSFTIKEPQCVNYDNPQQTACQLEEKTYDLDNLIDEIVNTVRTVDSGNKPPVACTMEAKLCPDGSAVGRTGPNCEFAPCPGR